MTVGIKMVFEYPLFVRLQILVRKKEMFIIVNMNGFQIKHPEPTAS